MSEVLRQRGNESGRRRLAILGTAALVLTLPAWFVWGPLGTLSYAAGLFNSMGGFILLFYLSGAALVGVIAFPVLIAQAVRTWRRQTRQGRRSLLLWIMLSGGFGAPFFLGLAGLSPSPFGMYARGFARYIESRADVEAIRGWLDTLDPNDYTNKYGGVQEERFMEARLPPCIAPLHPKWATVLPDERGRLMVRLLWGGGFIGHWGIVVGQKDLPTPPSGSGDRVDGRFALGPGAYVWSDE